MNKRIEIQNRLLNDAILKLMIARETIEKSKKEYHDGIISKEEHVKLLDQAVRFLSSVGYSLNAYIDVHTDINKLINGDTWEDEDD